MSTPTHLPWATLRQSRLCPPSKGRRIWPLKTLNSAWCLSELLASWAFFPCRWKKSRFVTDVRILFEEKLCLSNILTETYNDVKISKYAIYCYVSIHKPWLLPSYFVYIHQGGGKDERWCKRALLFYAYNTIHWSAEESMSSVLVLSIKIIDCVAQAIHPS